MTPAPGIEPNKMVILSVDLDMWWHCRWATGSARALWPDPDAAIRGYYGEGVAAPGDFPGLVDRTLELLAEAGARATFFLTGEMARRYPDVARRVAGGHELASHGMVHVDARRLTPREVTASVEDSKKLLEDLSGRAVGGFRFPNLVFDPAHFRLLAPAGYRYDASVCPSRRLFGKFGRRVEARRWPYRPHPDDPFRPGDSPLWEFPLPVFPGLRLPAATGVATRTFGVTWTRLALRHAARRGCPAYYFHPYELGRFPGLAGGRPYPRLFLRRTGPAFARQLRSLLAGLGRGADLVGYGDWLARTGSP